MGQFLMDCSRLSSIPGEGKKRDFIWFLLFSWLSSFGLLLVLLIRECHWMKRTSLSAMRQLPAQRLNVSKIWRDPGEVPVAVDGWVCIPCPRGAVTRRGFCPRFPTGSHPTMSEVGFCLHWALRVVRVATNALGWFSFSPRNTTQALPLGVPGKLSGKWLRLCPPRNPGFSSKFIWTTVPSRAHIGVSRSQVQI